MPAVVGGYIVEVVTPVMCPYESILSLGTAVADPRYDEAYDVPTPLVLCATVTAPSDVVAEMGDVPETDVIELSDEPEPPLPVPALIITMLHFLRTLP